MIIPRFQEAIKQLEKGLYIAEHGSFDPVYWPETDVVIEETKGKNLKVSFVFPISYLNVKSVNIGFYYMAQATSGEIACSDWLRRVTCLSVSFHIGNLSGPSNISYRNGCAMKQIYLIFHHTIIKQLSYKQHSE